MKGTKSQEKKLIFSAIALLVLAVLFWLLATDSGIKLLKKINFIKDSEPRADITISSANYEALKNKIGDAKIVSGYNNFVAITADGKVYGWGYNGYGQLGLGNTTSYTTPTYLGIDDAIDAAAGWHYIVVVRKDGTVWAAGYSGYGELGVGNTANSNVFVQVKNEDGTGFLNNIKSVSANENTVYAVTNDGDVYTWGRNNYGQMGFGNTSDTYLPKKTSLTNIKQISAGYFCAEAVTNDGYVYGAGYNPDGELGIRNSNTTIARWTKIPNLDNTGDMDNVDKVVAGRGHTLILTNDGKVYATGYNYYGELADGTTTARNYFAPMKDSDGNEITNAKNIYANAYSSYIINNNNELYACGYNNYGQLGTKDASAKNKLTKIETDVPVISMETTKNLDSQTMAYVDNIGRIYTVGYSSNGELGNGTTSTSPKYLPYSISDYRILADDAIVNLKAGQSQSISPYFGSGFNLINSSFSMNLTYESLDTSVATVSGNTISAVGIGTTYIRISDNTNKIYGSVKVNVNSNDGVTFPKIVGGVNHFIALKSDGTTYTWGYNSSGQLGLGDVVSRTEPVKTDIDNAIDVAAGTNFTGILRKDGTVWTTGYNGYGNLADGTTTNSVVFKQVPDLTDVVAISACENSMYALKKDGTVWGWGYNYYGELGNPTAAGSSNANSKPYRMLRVPGIMQISAGNCKIIMVSADGSVWVAGYNGYGELGLGHTSEIHLAQQMYDSTGSKFVTGIKEVDSGTYSTTLLTDDGRMYATGYNNYGQLGSGDTVQRLYIVPVIDEDTNQQITGVSHILVSGYMTMAIKNDKSLYETGYAAYSQNFSKTNTTRTKMHKVFEGKNIIAMGATKELTNQTGAVVDDKGRIWTVGYNAEGEIGNGTTETTGTPTCITNSKLDTSSDKIVNLKVNGDQHQITFN